MGAFTAWAILEIDSNSAYVLSGFSFFFGNDNCLFFLRLSEN